jgi:polyhydroxybutyrate depolymerase
MRLLSGLVLAAVAWCVVVACSGSSDTPANPDNGTSSSGGNGSSGASSSGEEGGTTPPVNNDIVTTTLENIDGRKYSLSVPKDYDAAKKYPLWIFMTGDPVPADGGVGFALHQYSKNEAIIAYPSAADTAYDHTAFSTDNADSTFILGLIDALAGKYSIDKGRVLLDGWSNGGFMASAMACRYSAKFRAIGVQAGGAPYDPNSQDPNFVPDCAGAAVATFVSHGKNDVTVDFNEFAGEYWAQHDGCGTTRTASTPAPCETYEGCPADKPVKVCFIPGVDHYGLFGQTFNAFAVEWAWFKSLP